MKRILFAIASVSAMLAVSTPALADLQLATAKYAGQKDAVAKLSAKVIKGGSGVWGPVPMPANAQVSPEEATKLVTWIMTQK